MNKCKLTLCGAEYRMRWDVEAILRLEDAGLTFDTLVSTMGNGMSVKTKMDVAAAMINSGEKLWDSEKEMTGALLAKMITPKTYIRMESAMYTAYTVGCHREDPGQEDTDEVVDEVLEEIRRKKKEAEEQQKVKEAADS